MVATHLAVYIPSAANSTPQTRGTIANSWKLCGTHHVQHSRKTSLHSYISITAIMNDSYVYDMISIHISINKHTSNKYV